MKITVNLLYWTAFPHLRARFNEILLFFLYQSGDGLAWNSKSTENLAASDAEQWAAGSAGLIALLKTFIR